MSGQAVVFFAVAALLLLVFVVAARRMERTADRIEATGDRIEQAVEGGRVLADRQRDVMRETLARMEKAAALVATNLAAAQGRADHAIGSDGAAADAGARSGLDSLAVLDAESRP